MRAKSPQILAAVAGGLIITPALLYALSIIAGKPFAVLVGILTCIVGILTLFLKPATEKRK
jgi:hypothetical protein